MNFIGRLQIGRAVCNLARQNFSVECERAINRQVAMELRICHEYLAMAYYFDRSDVALPGAYDFFKHASDDERSHAEELMKYMNKRGGQVVLEEIPAPKHQYASIMEAMKTALDLEKSVNESLLAMHRLASEHNDPNLCDFLETHFLQEQVESQKKLADYITQLERCDKKLGDFIFDRHLGDDKTIH